MTKRRRKTPKRSLAAKVQQQVKSEDAALGQRVGNAFGIITGLLFCITIAVSMFMINFTVEDISAKLWLYTVCLILSFTIFILIVIIFKSLIRREGNVWIFIPRSRKQAVLLLSLSFFNLVIIAIPNLHKYGYIASFNEWLQSLLPIKKISENFSLVAAFIAGAVVSGVLGNLAYDLLKFALKKAANRENRP